MLFSIHWQKNGKSGHSKPILDDYDGLQAICTSINRKRKSKSDIWFWVVAEIPMRFLVVSKVSRIVRAQFETAHETALYMWGKDFANYHIMKAGRAIQFSGFEIGSVEHTLDAG